MKTQPTQPTQPATPAAAEVCEFLKKEAEFCLFLKSQCKFSVNADSLQNTADKYTAALALIERGEQERERLEQSFKTQRENYLLLRDALLGEGTSICEADPTEIAKDLRAQLAAATERVKVLERALDDVLSCFRDMSEGRITRINDERIEAWKAARSVKGQP